MAHLAIRLILIAMYCLMSLDMAIEVVSHPEARDHAASILGLGFCLLILVALVRLKPPVLVRIAAALNGMIAAASVYILASYLLRHGVTWIEAKDLLTRAFLTIVVPVLAIAYFIGNSRASRRSQTAEDSLASTSPLAPEGAQTVIYDYGDGGALILTFSVPVVIGVSVLMISLAIVWPLTSVPTPSVWLQVAFLFAVGTWMGLLGLHYQRDKQAFSTRYVLTATGVEATPRGGPPQSIVWSQVSDAYHSRLLRYFKLGGPGISDMVLMFGAPPNKGTAQAKYRRTCNFFAEKLGDRLTAQWL
jgi:hypothetical protein